MYQVTHGNYRQTEGQTTLVIHFVGSAREISSPAVTKNVPYMKKKKIVGPSSGKLQVF